VSPHLSDSGAVGYFHKSCRHCRRIPSAFKGRKGEVCDFDDTIISRRCCEAARADDDVLPAIDGQIPSPRRRCAGSLEQCHSLLADRTKEIRFGANGEHVLGCEGRRIFRHLCPRHLIENEKTDFCQQIFGGLNSSRPARVGMSHVSHQPY
jgi:hypothetical protein